MPSRGLAARQAVTSTTESPYRTMTAPSACLASLPVSMVMVLRADGDLTSVHGIQELGQR